jgi:hypothetical protein
MTALPNRHELNKARARFRKFRDYLPREVQWILDELDRLEAILKRVSHE